jgi:hypothetical protein
MPWCRWLFAVLSLWRPGFTSWLVHVGFVGDKVALRKVFLQVLWFFPCQYDFTVAVHTHISSRECTVGPLVATVHRRSLTPSTWTTRTATPLDPF